MPPEAATGSADIVNTSSGPVRSSSQNARIAASPTTGSWYGVARYSASSVNSSASRSVPGDRHASS